MVISGVIIISSSILKLFRYFYLFPKGKEDIFVSSVKFVKSQQWIKFDKSLDRRHSLAKKF